LDSRIGGVADGQLVMQAGQGCAVLLAQACEPGDRGFLSQQALLLLGDGIVLPLVFARLGGQQFSGLLVLGGQRADAAVEVSGFLTQRLRLHRAVHPAPAARSRQRSARSRPIIDGDGSGGQVAPSPLSGFTPSRARTMRSSMRMLTVAPSHPHTPTHTPVHCGERCICWQISMTTMPTKPAASDSSSVRQTEM